MDIIAWLGNLEPLGIQHLSSSDYQRFNPRTWENETVYWFYLLRSVKKLQDP
jgi:hypothetical protein